MYNTGYFGIDIYYLVLVLPAFLISLFCQIKVQSTFKKYDKIHTVNGLNGFQAARAILDGNGLQHIRIEHISGTLSDHYDHQAGAIRLSDSTYSSASIGAVGVAAHEAGHAVQYAQNYGPIKLRTALVPITNIGAGLAWPAILFGYMLGLGSLVFIGIAAFSLAVLFQLVTLPVEFNASRRAIAILDQNNMLMPDEIGGAKKVLSAAALTYVAALLVSVANLIRMIALFGNKNNKS